jgi:hypothetical protein
MPIEIRELIIKVTVQDNADSHASQPNQPSGLVGDELRRWQQELTRTCVQQVLAELQRRNER